MKRPLRESDIEKYMVKQVKAAGGEVRKVQWIGRSGAPDRVIMQDADEAAAHLIWRTGANLSSDEAALLAREIVGLYITWPELKAPGKKAEPHQAREHERMRKMGQRVVVIDSLAGVDEVLS